MTKVFFSNQLNDYVADEMCECGHLKSEHGSLTRRIKGKIHRIATEGNCCASGHCDCSQYTFARFVSIKEKAIMLFGERVPA